MIELVAVGGILATVVFFAIGWEVTEGPKCVLCKKRGTKKYEDFRGYDQIFYDKDPIKSVWHWQYHGNSPHKDKRVYTYFHKTCVEEALCNPDDRDNAQLALDIIDKYKRNQERALEDAKRADWARRKEFMDELRRKLKLKSVCKKVKNDGLFLD